MSLNILTSGQITSKFGIRPALMVATKKDLSKHSVVRIISEDASGWIGIAAGHLITGAKCQKGTDTLAGFEALAIFMKLDSGAFDLIQMDSRLLGDELAQAIGINIDELLKELKATPDLPIIDVLRKCKKSDEALALATEANEDRESVSVADGGEELAEDAGEDLDDDEWDLDGVEFTPTEDLIAGSEPVIQMADNTGTIPDQLAFANDGEAKLQNTPIHESLLYTAVATDLPGEALGKVSGEAPGTVPGKTPPEAPAKVPAGELPGKDVGVPAKAAAEAPGELPGEVSKESLDYDMRRLRSISEQQEHAFSQFSPAEDRGEEKSRFVIVPAEGDISASSGAAAFSEQNLAPILEEPVASNSLQKAKLSADSIDLPPSSPNSAAVSTAGPAPAAAPSAAASNEAITPPAAAANEAPISEIIQTAQREVNPEAREESPDRLGAELRAELKEFVKSKFGVDDNESFQSVDIRRSKEYQSSLVLKDLESAIERSKTQASPGKAGSDNNLERPSTQTAYKGHGDASSDSLGESSRKVLSEHVIRKSGAIDAKTFIANQDDENKFELGILKDSRIRNIIVLVASVCVLLSGVLFVFFSAEKQSALQAASDKLISGDYPGAREAYAKIIKAHPGNWQAHLGHALASPQDFKQQVKDLTKVLEIKPDEASAAITLSRAYLELHEYERAAEAADHAFKLKASVTALKIKGQGLLKLGKYESAIEVFTEALKMANTGKAELNYLISLAYKELDEPEKEAEALQAALKEDASNALYQRELALIRVGQKNEADARKELQKALALNPGDGELHYHLAMILEKESAEKAIDELTAAIEHNYANLASLGARGRLYFAKKTYGAAKVDFQEALSKKPDKKLQKMLDQTDQAIHSITKASAGTRQLPSEAVSNDEAIAPEELQGDYVGKAYDLMKLGKITQAKSLLKAAVKANPNDMRARRYLAHAFYNSSDYVSASNQFSLVSAAGLSYEEQFLYGKSLLRAKRNEQAIKILQNLVSQQPAFYKARVELIKAYTLSGFKDHARQECKIGMQQAKDQNEYAEFQSLLP